MADGLPGVAGVKAERLLKRKGWTRVETRQLATFAAEAWARAEDGTRVLALAEAHDLDDETFWRGLALVLNDNLPAARKLLTEDDTTPRQPRTQLLLARVLAAMGETAAARADIAPLLSSADESLSAQALLLQKEMDLEDNNTATALNAVASSAADIFLRARALLQNGRLADAQEAALAVMNSTSGGERIHHAALLLQAEILLRQNHAAEAQERLVKFLDETADCRLWTEAFDLLNRSHQALPAPRTLPEVMLRWIAAGCAAQQQPQPPTTLLRATTEFRGHALFVLAQWLANDRRISEATGLLEAFLQSYTSHPRLSDAMRHAMELYAEQGADERVLSLADSWHEQFGEASATVDSSAGAILFRRGEPSQALRLFQNAANVATTLDERRRALFNAGLAAILAGDAALYQVLLGQLAVAGATAASNQDDAAATLEFEKALFLAANRKSGAEEALRAFLRDHPGHPRFADASNALAELMLLAVPPRVQDARAALDAVAAAPLVPAQRERIEHTRLWLHDAAGDLKSLLNDGAAFLKAWPDSKLKPEVRLKMASAHYRLEDFASARTEFEIIARDYPDTPHADTALYFAAMSAASVMSAEGRGRALAIWEELAAKGGPLAVAARRQQALSERVQGNLQPALAALDKLLALPSLEPEQRRTTLCEKAEVLLLLGKTSPAQLDAAADLLDAFLTDATLPFFWKARAGFTLATVHRDAGHDTEALDACYNVLRAAGITPPASPADYIWFAKTGFFGVDLLEASRQWEAAARLAEQIAQRPGERAAEARERATKIRLEHFLWDGPAPVPPKVLKPDETPAPKPAEPEKPATKSTTKKKSSR